MCPRKSLINKPGYMSFELFEKMIEEISRSWFLFELILSGFGEPLLHPRILDMIKLAKSKGVPKVRLTTSAVLLKRDTAKKIICESGLDEIGLSLDASTPETYLKMKRSHDFLRVKNNIRGFLDERKKRNLHKPFVKLHMIEVKPTSAEIDEFIEEWQPLMGPGDRILLKYFHDVSGLVEDIGFPERDLESQRRPCSQIWGLVYVSWNGDVMPCCIDILKRLRIGNIEESSIEEIWSGPAMWSLRQTHLRGDYKKIPICAQCGAWWYLGKKPKGIGR
jgi:radical SAM protein with 4Fe4S-binding SPASM domain